MQEVVSENVDQAAAQNEPSSLEVEPPVADSAGPVPDDGGTASAEVTEAGADPVEPRPAAPEPPPVVSAPKYYKLEEPAIQAALKFESTPLTQKIFLNSVPKCGTMLLRNIVLMFTGVDEFYEPMLSTTNMDPLLTCPEVKFFYGHVNCTPDSRAILSKFKHLVLVRDPYDYVAAYARFFYSEQLSTESELGKYIQLYKLTFDDVVPFVINGWNLRGEDHPNIRDQFILNALLWLNDRVMLVKYEDIVANLRDLQSPQADQFFTDILSFLCIPKPEDWRTRVIAGSDRAISSTSSEKIESNSPGLERKGLNNFEKNIVNIVAPNLRSILGYS